MAQVFTRRRLRAEGWDDAAVGRALRSGRLIRVARDRFAEPGPVGLEEIVAAPGSGVALCGGSAARAWGLPWSGDSVSVLLPRGARRPSLSPAVCVRTTRHWAAVERDGVLVTDLPSTLRDVAAELPLQEAVPVLDAGLRAGVELNELLEPLAGAAPGRRRARRAIGLADGRAESPLESLLRLTLALAGLPPADLQHVIREDGRFAARVDLWYPGLVVEADGFEFHSRREEYRRDRRKGQVFARLGLLAMRFSWEDVMGGPDTTVASVRAAAAALA